ncbi:MAG TPA: lysophospholipid acyltransferase family protein [Anaerolineales bacterium]
MAGTPVNPLAAPYEHARYERRRRLLRWLIHNFGYRVLARFDGADGLEHLPPTGPVIIYFNHIAFIDPIVVLSCLPRNGVPMARHDVFSIPLWGIFPRIWEVIPVRRGEADRQALRGAMRVLRAGETVLIAPEGTRGQQLQRGKVGLAYLGARAQATMVPAAVEGTAGFPSLSLARRRMGGARVRFGRGFRYRAEGARPGRDQLRRMTDEAMYVLSALLPEQRRGVYADLDQATTDTVDFV